MVVVSQPTYDEQVQLIREMIDLGAGQDFIMVTQWPNHDEYKTFRMRPARNGETIIALVAHGKVQYLKEGYELF
jgi:hypothetical protein